MRDDLAQTHAALQLLATLSPDVPGFVPLVVLAEVWWVLNRRYQLDRAQVAVVMEGLLFSSNLIVESSELAFAAFTAFQSCNADFADCLIQQCATHAGCSQIFTFDRNAARSAGMTLLK